MSPTAGRVMSIRTVAPWLYRLARMGWVLLTALALLLFAAGIPARFQILQVVCRGDGCAHFQLSAASVDALQGMGLSLGGYAVYLSVVVGLGVLAYLGLAGVLVWRQRGNWVALTFAAAMVASLPSFYFSVTEALMRTSPLWQLPLSIVQALGVWLVFTAYCVFPNGRFVPAWTRLLVPVALLISLPAALAAPLPVFARVAAVLLLVGVGLQIYRYRHVFTASERLRSKWVLLGTTILATFLVVLNFTPVVVPGLRAPGVPEVLYALVGATVTVVISLLYVTCTAIAMLKYRLFDIDVILTRTLVYTALTAFLAMIYGASVVVFQSTFRGVIGQESDLAIIVSTLVTAAIFQPLRRQIQTTIDRRFYRRRYDAAQALEHFAAAARDEVDLDRLADRLISVAEETMQPAHISLWLRPTRPSEPSG